MEHKLNKLAQLIEKQTLERLNKQYPESYNKNPHFWERDAKVHVIPGRKYTKIDVGLSGKYMIDQDGNIFGIKGYGVIHRGHFYGTLDTINQYYWGEYVAQKI